MTRVKRIIALHEIRHLIAVSADDLDAAIDQVQYIIEEDLPCGNEWIDPLRILLGKIEMQG